MSKYWSSRDNMFHPIPDAPYYVLCNDKFMSGWGGARGKINTCVVPCDLYEEVKKVIEYIESRRDQKYIRYVINKPRTKSHVLYSLLDEWKENVKC